MERRVPLGLLLLFLSLASALGLLHRYLTADEMAGFLRNRPLTELLPEMRPPPDNATGAK